MAVSGALPVQPDDAASATAPKRTMARCHMGRACREHHVIATELLHDAHVVANAATLLGHRAVARMAVELADVAGGRERTDIRLARRRDIVLMGKSADV